MHRNAETLKRLNEAEKKLKEEQVKAYIDLDVSNKEREAGNQVSPPVTAVVLHIWGTMSH